MRLQVEDNSNLYRDTSSGAIINTNKLGAQISRDARAKILEDKNRIIKLESEMGEIKALLKQLLEK